MRARAIVLILTTAFAASAAAQSSLNPKFDAERGRLHSEAAAARAARKLSLDDDAMHKQYPSSAIQPVPVKKIAPGGSTAIALAGIIPAGVTVLSDRDGAVLSAATMTRSSYAARLTVGAGEGPGFVKLHAITPVSNSTTPVAVAFIDTIYRFELKAADGLTIKLTPLEKTFSMTNEDRDARLQYQAEFFKPGELKPFETRAASMLYLQGDDPQNRLDISVGDSMATKSGMQEMDEIGKQLADPKLTESQRNALTERYTRAQMRAMDEMLKGATMEAAKAADKKTDDFGCRLVQIDPGAGGTAKATVLCGKNFYKGVIQATGTMAQVK